PLMEDHQSCNRIEFKVDAKGKAQDFHVWAHYLMPNRGYHVGNIWLAPNKFDRFTMQALSRWRFHPHIKNGEPVPTEHVIRSTSYTSNILSFPFFRTLEWLCTLPPMHGVHIVVASRAIPVAAATAVMAVRAEDGKSIDLGPIFVTLNPKFLPQKIRRRHVWLQFCVDVSGRVSDVMVRGPKPDLGYVLTARRALEKIKFPVRRLKGKLVLTCGLRVRARFDAVERKPGSTIGLLGPIFFDTLKETLPEPKLETEKPAHISLSIPAGTKLPPVAKVEVRFCIDKDGSVGEPEVIKAIPARYFDQAAIETVKGWRFASPARRLCDVYQWVKFPLSGAGH
ncbi:MAG: TonB family protein, partial [Gammaproteobacteria bacterium]